ncbi:inositol monophosphatase [Halorussus sp. MSC15.2]|uniref:inositol monophosphatase family protein n=1 Tax=Halorussus sp. MSC15.2 TaxID=2283638 RepID=UPI0013D79CCA|nr:inositol monophosphatase [Halorussus sp. MSC15.2]NEU56201.1 inositol monophosphatase [Halorussus sp. MSC15.2]
MTDDAEERLAVAKRAAREGSEVAAESFRQGIDVETKSGKTDVVTEADRRTQRRVIEVIREEYPDDAIVGEEEDELKAVPDEGDAWVIDPIDGTNNYVRSIPVWTTSVAAVRDGDPVAAVNDCPALDDTFVAGADGVRRDGEAVSVSERTDPETFAVSPTFWWDFDRRDEYAEVCRELVERFADIRRFGSAQVTLGMVAAGSLEGAVTNVDPNPWDTVAGVHMVRQAGGTVTDRHGDPWRHDSESLVASNGEAHEQFLGALENVA